MADNFARCGGGGGGPVLDMRLNVWVVLVILIALFAMTRYIRHQRTPHLCLEDPAASVCQR
jgi:hypothetical protein